MNKKLLLCFRKLSKLIKFLYYMITFYTFFATPVAYAWQLNQEEERFFQLLRMPLKELSQVTTGA